MASEIREKLDAKAAFTITIASLTNSSARQSTEVANTTGRSAVRIWYKLTTGTSPTAGSVINIRIFRANATSSATIRDDNAGASDAAITVVNAPVIQTVPVSATSDTSYYGSFEVTPEMGGIGFAFGVIVENLTGATLNATGGNQAIEYSLMVMEAQ